ncbi:hypothetical protein LPJ66_002794 [Kickxella alabastrina]|uniref:Uncharacterized protein n=1 Tax=Kickxella alabastrina TaxID=61397 RepID=A0ACC1IPG5_9FUNG|nr:hypothetical protein LPJ66_002794 [Kickxella alabastrina]
MARKVGYFTAWSIYDRKYTPLDVPVERLTHVNYAFANLTNNCIALGDPWADTDKPYDDGVTGNIGLFNSAGMRRRNPNLRLMISVGGWTWSGGFSMMAADAAGRAEFVRSVGEFLAVHGFDGVDVDWEHPVEGGLDGNARSPDDARNYLLLLRDLRQHLDERASGSAPRFGRYEISIATSAAPTVYRHLDLAAIAEVVDHINIMAYDFAGPWSSTTAHQQNLFAATPNSSGLSAHDTVSDYIARGVPPHKIVLGVGFYARGFSNVDPGQSPNEGPVLLPGLGCPFAGVPDGTWEPGSFDYKALRGAQLLPGSGYASYWDDQAKAPILYSESERVLISYEDAVAVSWKADYVLRRALGGIMIWELSQDCSNELLEKICEYLG